MGHTNQIARAKDLIKAMLHFDLVQAGEGFEIAVKRAGMERFEHCIRLVELWARPTTSHRQKYDRLMQLLRLVTPDKVGKYRNPQSQLAHDTGLEMDRRAIEAANADR